MDRNIDFYNEHGKSIKLALRNSKLSGDKLQKRISLMRKGKGFKDKDYAIKFLNEIENRFVKIINSGKNQFSEEDIDIIIHDVLGIDLRQYDKSHLADLSKKEIKSIDKIVKNDKAKPYPFGDTIITHLGDVIYTEWFSRKNRSAAISCYKVEKKDDRGEIAEYEIFSNINIGRMQEDPDYRAAVIDVLLDKNNILKTNCGGYVGEIRTINEGKGLEDTVRANGRYSLVFDSADATAVVMLRNIVKERQEKEKQAKNQSVEQDDAR